MFSLRLRLIVAAVAIVGAAALIIALRPPKPTHALPEVPSFKRWAPWFNARRQEWQDYHYVDIADGAALRAAVAGWVGSRPAGPQVDEDLLIAEIVRFFENLAQPDADAYLRAVAGRRELRDHLADDTFVQACYHEMTGRTLPTDMDPRKTLAEFWRGHPDSVPRPVAVSREAYLEIEQSKSLASCPSPRPLPFSYNAVCPVYSVYKSQDILKKWNAPVVGAVIRLTRPKPTLEEVLHQHETTLTGVLGCVLSAADGWRGILRVDMYYCPDEGVWQVEVATTGFDRQLFWPM